VSRTAHCRKHHIWDNSIQDFSSFSTSTTVKNKMTHFVFFENSICQIKIKLFYTFSEFFFQQILLKSLIFNLLVFLIEKYWLIQLFIQELWELSVQFWLVFFTDKLNFPLQKLKNTDGEVLFLLQWSRKPLIFCNRPLRA
jgi:hypothetical protein